MLWHEFKRATQKLPPHEEAFTAESQTTNETIYSWCFAFCIALLHSWALPTSATSTSSREAPTTSLCYVLTPTADVLLHTHTHLHVNQYAVLDTTMMHFIFQQASIYFGGLFSSCSCATMRYPFTSMQFSATSFSQCIFSSPAWRHHRSWAHSWTPRKKKIKRPPTRLQHGDLQRVTAAFLQLIPPICFQPDKLLSVIYGSVSVSVAPELGDFYTSLWHTAATRSGLIYGM